MATVLAASNKLATLSISTSTVHWALLRNFALHLWPVDEQKLEAALLRGHAPQVDISRKPPFTLAIDRHTRLLRVSNSSLTLESDKGVFVFGVYNCEQAMISQSRHHHHHHQQQLQQLAGAGDEIGSWLRPIEQLIYDSHIWGATLTSHNKLKQQQQVAAGDARRYQQQQYFEQQQQLRDRDGANKRTNNSNASGISSTERIGMLYFDTIFNGPIH